MTVVLTHVYLWQQLWYCTAICQCRSLLKNKLQNGLVNILHIHAFVCSLFLSSIGLKDHLHSPNVHFHNIGLWGSDVTNGGPSKKWTLRKLSSIRSKLGHNEVSMLSGLSVSIVRVLCAIFTARRVCIARICRGKMSVRLSHAGIVSKPL